MVVSVLVGALGGLVSLGMPGVGHGWYSGLIGLVSVPLAPAAGYALANRGVGGGISLAVGVLAAGILADIGVVFATKHEGWSYMTGMGESAVLWWFLFLLWQVAAAVALIPWRQRAA